MSDEISSSGTSHRALPVSSEAPLQHIFGCIQYIFQSPTNEPGQCGIIVERFHKMSHAEIDILLKEWRIHMADGLDPSQAERMSLEMLQHHVQKLFYSQRGFSVATEARVAYESFRFDTAMQLALDNYDVTLKQWVTEWWLQKMKLLVVALHREALDCIRRPQTNRMDVRSSVLRMVANWEQKGCTSDTQFTISVVKEYHRDYMKDRRLIEGLFDHLPHADANWTEGKALFLMELKDPASSAGIPAISLDSFNSISDLQDYTLGIMTHIQPLRLNRQVALLHATTAQQSQSLGKLELSVLKSQNEALQAQLKELRTGKEEKTAHQPRSFQAPVNSVSQPDVAYPYGAASPQFSTQTSPSTSLYYQQMIHGCSTLCQPFDEEDGADDHVYLCSNYVHSFISKSQNETLQLLTQLGLDRNELGKLFPVDTQRQLWAVTPPKQPPQSRASTAALIQAIQLHPDKIQSQRMLEEFRLIVQSVAQRLGANSSQPVSIQDLTGCKRTLGPSHLGRGSHGTLSCPQAYLGGLEQLQALHELRSLLTHECLLEVCQSHRSDRHDPDKCKAKDGQYPSCQNCRTYMYHEVYPRMHEAQIKVLQDQMAGDIVKHECRVQLAMGILTGVWGGMPPVA